ncbi:putative protein family UPF0615 [Cordyceps fumosorosea ARSEF 2679]|uniref:Uncharacterized protein n=1 Tax=Cordyceps fumosorosea (strain ARSEF 2679) TaxID=1081104 RepID=A0A162J0X4_CORFA|nr:putative protein family UPF0615 [Cordyceps fumosorosea ARSEF 2679]OAA62172.1 putative protein family UPF0615 [Cordyceps fumosorosea ARSEF 2679]
MASKKTKTPAAEDNLDELFSGIGGDAKAGKAAPKSSKAGGAKSAGDTDILADLESQLASAPPTSRPHTPRIGGKRPGAGAPAAEDKRKSTDSARSARASFTPSATSSELQDADKKVAVEQPPAASGGSWWGGIMSTASAAMKQAEAAYKEVQQNEDAKKWAEQVRGFKGLDIGALRNYGDDLRHRALPTFTNILNTIAPPISSHERLLIHITHDLVGYPSMDPLIHGVFSRVMSQVEGGDLLVVQRGQESGSRRARESNAGWRDGPWWRQSDSVRELGLIKGLTEGTKLCRANAEGYAEEYFSATGGVEQAKTRATEDSSETNPVRTSNLFLAIQAIETDDDGTLFARTASAEKDKEDKAEKEEEDSHVSFAVFILDPVHQIEYATVSQSMPAKWARWLDTNTPLTPKSGDDEQAEADSSVPAEIRDIIDSGAVDPREWVAEWIEETLSLSIGIVAQRYVARRMGVGEDSLGKAKRKMEELVYDNAGEAARAGAI